MNNKTIFFCMISLTLLNSLRAQNSGINPKPQKEEINEKFNIVKFEPIQLIDPLNTFYLSFEKQAGSHSSLQAGLGYIFYNYMDLYEYATLDKGAANFKVKVEYRIYCKDIVKGRTSWFFAPQLFYKQTIYNSQCFEYIRKDDSLPDVTFIDKFIIQQQEFGIYTKTGFQRISKKGFVFELYFGPGIKYVNSKTIGKINNTDLFYSLPLSGSSFTTSSFSFTSSNESNHIGDGLNTCFTIGISIGKCFSNISGK